MLGLQCQHCFQVKDGNSSYESKVWLWIIKTSKEKFPFFQSKDPSCSSTIQKRCKNNFIPSQSIFFMKAEHSLLSFHKCNSLYVAFFKKTSPKWMYLYKFHKTCLPQTADFKNLPWIKFLLAFTPFFLLTVWRDT